MRHRASSRARAHPQINRLVERFNCTVVEELFHSAWRRALYTLAEMLEHDLDEWLHTYNYERPHQGYRNLGCWPIETPKQHQEG